MILPISLLLSLRQKGGVRFAIHSGLCAHNTRFTSKVHFMPMLCFDVTIQRVRWFHLNRQSLAS